MKMATNSYEQAFKEGWKQFRKPDGTVVDTSTSDPWKHGLKMVNLMKFLIKLKASRPMSIPYERWEVFYAKNAPK